jgi:hypothetical protein
MLANKEGEDKKDGSNKKESSMKTDEPTLKVMTAALKEIEEADSDSSHFTSS